MPLLLFTVNVLAFSLVIALFEIVIEKDHGWCTAFGPFWGRKWFESGVFAQCLEGRYLTTYHITMFLVVIPLLLFGEYCYLKAEPLVFVAAWLEITVVEDFLWFLLNWYYPGSLRQLFAGEIWWHPRYAPIGKILVPVFYLVLSSIAAELLLLQCFVS